jgi:hypothetical protein
VCGDHFELDLAMPHVLGASVCYVQRPSSPLYEIQAVKAMGRKGRVVTDLTQVVQGVLNSGKET